MRPSSAGGKTFSSGSRSALAMPFGIGHQLGVLAHVRDQLGAGVGRQQDQRVLEVDHAALAVFHPALVEDLEEHLVHVRMGLLDFVEQHDAIRPAADGLGQHAAFAVADVARRRALERARRCALPGTRSC